MRLHHIVFLVLIASALLFPKLIWWISGVVLFAAVVMLLMGGPVMIANLFAPRPPKR